MFISGKSYAFINANGLWSDVLHFTGIKRRAYNRNQCNFCQGIFVSGTVMRLSMRMVYKVMYYILQELKEGHTTEINVFINATSSCKK